MFKNIIYGYKWAKKHNASLVWTVRAIFTARLMDKHGAMGVAIGKHRWTRLDALKNF